tara:strand:- start:349 stop:597 length:249 start_codon:yes stop_codon:yes gene_type:complete
MKKYDYFTKEAKSADCHVLYGWGTYPSYSVLAGQASKSYLRSFDTSEELEAFMSEEGISGEWSNQWVEPQISLNQLSDEGDY